MIVQRTALVVAMLPGLAWADQVTLKNGDRVTGKIVKKDGGKLTLKSDIFGSVDIPWDAVTEVTSDEQLVVVLPESKSVQGKISTKDNQIEVSTPTSKESVGMAEVAAIRNSDEQKAYERRLDPGWLNLWSGYADLGVALARGNAKSDTISTALNAARVTNGDKTTLYFNQIYARATVGSATSATAQAVRGGLAYSRNVASRLFVNVLNDYEYDRFQNLDLRFVLGGGLGYVAVKNERTRLDLLGGFAYNRESFGTGLMRNSGEVFWGDDFTYKLTGTHSLRQSYRMFHNLTNTGEYRINFDIGSVTGIRKWLAWQLTFSDRYLTNPLPGRKTNDILFTTGLRFSFERQ